MVYNKILVVDDTEENIEILNELLGEDYEVLSALDGEFAIEIAHEDKPDLILLDVMMPGMDGFEVCRVLQLNKDTKDIPIVFITAKTDDKSIEEGYKVGGADYITKPFRPMELLAKVRRELRMQELIHNFKKSQDELKFLASTDSMTKLYNRRYFLEASVNIINIAQRDKNNMSILMLDIDKFKNINDTYGHDVGDNVIVVFANILKNNVRKSDLVCRWGGEEFIILLHHTNIDDAFKLAEKIRHEIELLYVKIKDDKAIQFTTSIGVSTVDSDLELAIKKSDEALYEAKESGRNKVCLKK